MSKKRKQRKQLADRVLVLTDTIDNSILVHPAVTEDKKLRKKLDKIYNRLVEVFATLETTKKTKKVNKIPKDSFTVV